MPGEPPQLMITDDSRNPNYKAVSDLPGWRDGRRPFPVYDSDTEKWGYIDKSGEWVIEPEYDDACVFSDGLGLVHSEDKGVGFVNAQGELVMSGYTGATSFSEGVAFVWGKPDDEKNGIKHNDRYAAIDKNGAWRSTRRKALPKPIAIAITGPYSSVRAWAMLASKMAKLSTSTTKEIKCSA